MKFEEFTFKAGSKRVDFEGQMFNPGQVIPSDVVGRCKGIATMIRLKTVVCDPYASNMIFWAQNMGAKEAYQINCGIVAKDEEDRATVAKEAAREAARASVRAQLQSEAPSEAPSETPKVRKRRPKTKD